MKNKTLNMSDDSKEIVIIGSGYAGIELYRDLDKKKLNNCNITLISKTNYFYHSVASPRALVDNNVAEDICIKLDRVIKGQNRQFIHAEVVSIDSKSSIVTFNRIESNQNDSIKFDYLVLAIGSNYSDPFHSSESKRENQISLIDDYFNKVKLANRILIVGGGAVGVELAGEFKTDFPNKKVTIITNGNELVPNVSKGFSSNALKIMNKLKVEIIFNDKINLANVENFKTSMAKTENGIELEFDAYFICVGVKPCSDFLKKCLPNCLDEKGFIKIKDTFQLESNESIFALGDCCNLDEPKMALKAKFQVPCAAHNIEQLLKNNGNKLKRHKISSFKMMILSVGKNEGIFQLGNLAFKGLIPTLIKSRSLFISKTKAEMGYSESSTNLTLACLSLAILSLSYFFYFFIKN
jgi:apoptosis-inducing factor 2